MSHKGPVRTGQLIAPFGPGALVVDRFGHSYIVCGLDHWYKQEAGPNQPLQTLPDDQGEFLVHEWRLQQEVGIPHLYAPPDHRPLHRGESAPHNSELHIPVLRFPRWYVRTRDGEMRLLNSNQASLGYQRGDRWVPVRFIAICTNGHIEEFPWAMWLGCGVADDGFLPACGGTMTLTDTGTPDLAGVRLQCTCGRESTTLSNATSIERGQGDQSGTIIDSGVRQRLRSKGYSDTCRGLKPWLGDAARDTDCDGVIVGALRSGLNVYFARTRTSIFVPQETPGDGNTQRIAELVETNPQLMSTLKTLWTISPQAVVTLTRDEMQKGGIDGNTLADKDLLDLIQACLMGTPRFQEGAAGPSEPERQGITFRRIELNAIRQEVDDGRDLRVRTSAVHPELARYITCINKVERLRETKSFCGFTRIQPDYEWSNQGDMAERVMRQLFRTPPTPEARWLPAVEVRGEGVLIELNREEIGRWLRDQGTQIEARLEQSFLDRLAAQPLCTPPLTGNIRSWAAQYLLLHSLAHILINQFVFQCGYSAASLRERVYISTDQTAPMSALLIYTAAGDSEGTLGGLVRLGEPERFRDAFCRALQRASWCSADPVCSEQLGGQGPDRVNLAACHGCILLPETSCETVNRGLDRGVVIGTPENRELGFFAELLREVLQ